MKVVNGVLTTTSPRRAAGRAVAADCSPRALERLAVKRPRLWRQCWRVLRLAAEFPRDARARRPSEKDVGGGERVRLASGLLERSLSLLY